MTPYCTAEQRAVRFECDNEEALRRVVEQAPSKAANTYGKPFLPIFKDAYRDFYKVDPNLFAPAVLIINNVQTGRILGAGQINIEALKESFGL